MIQVDTSTLQQGLHLTVGTRTTIDVVLATVVLVRGARNYQLRVGLNLKFVRSRLQ